MALQNDIDHLKDLMDRGLMTAAQANVELVRIKRFQLVLGILPYDVRKALNEAVKRGELKRMKKDRYKPECYYHPTFAYLANTARQMHAQRTIESVAKVAGLNPALSPLP